MIHFYKCIQGIIHANTYYTNAKFGLVDDPAEQ